MIEATRTLCHVVSLASLLASACSFHDYTFDAPGSDSPSVHGDGRAGGASANEDADGGSRAGSGGRTAGSGGDSGSTAGASSEMPDAGSCDGGDCADAGECLMQSAESCVSEGGVPDAGECDGGECTDAGECPMREVESCANEGVDDDCNGEEDDVVGLGTGCEVSTNQGICRFGTLQCQSDSLVCVTAAQEAESCANEGVDNDCNGDANDVPDRGAACEVSTNQGVCRFGTLQCQNSSLVCVTPEPLAGETACDNRDEDCDGMVDDGFDLQSDQANCGRCGNVCGEGLTCCNGACTDTSSDQLHCGTCGNPCHGGLCCGGGCAYPPSCTVKYCFGNGGCGDGCYCSKGSICVPGKWGC
jgi:hypothetical protein